MTEINTIDNWKEIPLLRLMLRWEDNIKLELEI
jgi:hypothetical protein